MDKLNFALVGCGRIAKKHADILSSQIKGARLKAVCDIDTSKAENFGHIYNVPYYKNLHDMLGKEEIDVVNILTPSGMHAQHTLEVCEYKKHVVVEKPMALTLKDADMMIRGCEVNGVKLFVVKQNRYNLAIQKLKHTVNNGDFGKLVMGTVRVRWCRKQNYYDMDSWRGTWAMDGGVFTNQASHHIDLLEWIMGDVETVYAKSGTMLVKIETEDTGVAVLKFSNGALGIIEATTATRPVDLEGSISILGEKGTVEIGGFAVNQIKTWQFENQRDDVNELIRKYSQNPSDVYGFGHSSYLQNVCDNIQNNMRPCVDGYEGRKSLELINAIYESIETNQEVPLKFNPKKSRLGTN